MLQQGRVFVQVIVSGAYCVTLQASNVPGTKRKKPRQTKDTGMTINKLFYAQHINVQEDCTCNNADEC